MSQEEALARPRSEEARRHVVAATAEVVATLGVDKLTIEEVAARSGVAKTTIYRHWSSRSALVIDAVRSCFEHLVTPDTGDLRRDLLDLFSGMVKVDLSGQIGRIIPSLLDAAGRDPDIARLVDRIGEERQAPIREIIGRAQARGELPGDLDIEVAIACIMGPVLFRNFQLRLRVTDDYLGACVDTVIAGLRATRPAATTEAEPAPS
jgi:AcrR family transcriptional regulator